MGQAVCSSDDEAPWNFRQSPTIGRKLLGQKCHPTPERLKVLHLLYSVTKAAHSRGPIPEHVEAEVATPFCPSPSRPWAYLRRLEATGQGLFTSTGLAVGRGRFECWGMLSCCPAARVCLKILAH